jgi:drug/metabolite transporter (DMT)-like permease
MAIQLVEPAVVFTIFSGVIPIAASLAGHFGFRDAPLLRNTVEAFGYVLLALGMVALTAFTLMGWSGFVRGGPSTAAGGLSLAALSGALIAGMLLYSRRLDRAGVGPVAQFGLRFPLYIILTTFGFLLGLDDKGPMTEMDLLLAFVAGLILLAFPIYAVQKAVSLTSTLTIGAFAAMGPLVVFALQVLEGRVGYSRATLLGLTIYFVGALIAVVGSTRATLTENLES